MQDHFKKLLRIRWIQSEKENFTKFYMIHAKRIVVIIRRLSVICMKSGKYYLKTGEDKRERFSATN